MVLYTLIVALILTATTCHAQQDMTVHEIKARYLQWRTTTAELISSITEDEQSLSSRGLHADGIDIKSYTKKATCTANAYKKMPKVKLYGHIAAFAPEYTDLVAEMKNKVTIDRAGRRFILGVFKGKPLVTTISGIGPMNMALTAQVMIDLFPVYVIIQTGIAGGIDPSKRIGDVVIPKKWANYQLGKYIRTNTDGGFLDFGGDFPSIFYKDETTGNVPSFIRPECAKVDSAVADDGKLNLTASPSIKTSGMFVPMLQETFVKPTDALATPLPPQQFWYDVPGWLIRAAERALKKGIVLERTGFDPINQKNFTFEYQPEVTIGNAGVSGPTFVDNAEFREDTFKAYNAQVLEMESASFMMVCKSNKIPGIVIRSVSDLAGGSEGINVILSFISFAATNSIKVLAGLLQQL